MRGSGLQSRLDLPLDRIPMAIGKQAVVMGSSFQDVTSRTVDPAKANCRQRRGTSLRPEQEPLQHSWSYADRSWSLPNRSWSLSNRSWSLSNRSWSHADLSWSHSDHG